MRIASWRTNVRDNRGWVWGTYASADGWRGGFPSWNLFTFSVASYVSQGICAIVSVSRSRAYFDLGELDRERTTQFELTPSGSAMKVLSDGLKLYPFTCLEFQLAKEPFLTRAIGM